MARLITAILGGAACGACGADHGARPDPDAVAAIDAPDEPGPCGAGQLVAGELVDLDATPAQPRGVAGARLALEGIMAPTVLTAATGRFQLCAPAAATFTLDVDAPADYLDGKLYIAAAALQGRPLSLRGFTPTRAAQLYPFDAGRGHVLVFLAGDRSALAIDRPHAQPLAGNDDAQAGVYTWSPGSTGRYVLFPNVDATASTVTLTGDPAGPHTLPVSPGALTLAAISFVFL